VETDEEQVAAAIGEAADSAAAESALTTTDTPEASDSTETTE
jgi:hypothetical protein